MYVSVLIHVYLPHFTFHPNVDKVLVNKGYRHLMLLRWHKVTNFEGGYRDGPNQDSTPLRRYTL